MQCARYGGKVTSIMQHESVPRHIAFIMDGNGRWAKARGLSRADGHRAGVKALREIIKYCGDINIRYVTVYAFSTENFRRPASEVAALMSLICEFLHKDLKTLKEKGVKLRILGNVSLLPAEVTSDVQKAVEETEQCTKMTLSIALAYGGRDDIIKAARSLAADAAAGKISPSDIDGELFASRLYTAGIPDPDVIIRTSGEMRISNFLLYQNAYSELIFTDTLWPDFNSECLDAAIQEYNCRQRRYGGV